MSDSRTKAVATIRKNILFQDNGTVERREGMLSWPANAAAEDQYQLTTPPREQTDQEVKHELEKKANQLNLEIVTNLSM